MPEAEQKAGEQDKNGLHLPGWVREWTMKLLPWAFMAIIGTGVGLIFDNIKNKETIDRNSWRNDKQDERDIEIIARMERLELRMDRKDERDADKQREDETWQSQVLDYLQKIMKLKR